MPLPIYIMSSNMIGQRQRLDTVADNVANVNTVGYKRQTLDFMEVLSQQQQTEVGSFSHHNGTTFEFVQGALQPTNNPLDVALMGDGFFVVDNNGTPTYTRNGHFTVSGNGQLVNDYGQTVLDANNAPINIPADSTFITITPEGSITNQNGAIADLGVYRFEDTTRLTRVGNGGYISEDQQAQLAVDARISQGFLESSNVNSVEETVKMTELARAYQSAARLISSMEDLEQRAIRSLPSLQ